MENGGQYLVILYFYCIYKSSCLNLGSIFFIFIMAKFSSLILCLLCFYLWNGKQYKKSGLLLLSPSLKILLGRGVFLDIFPQLSQKERVSPWYFDSMFNH